MSTGNARRDRVIAGACIDCGGEMSAGCSHCDGTGREPHDERWFYFSFADASLPRGSQFLGGCYVQAASLTLAVAKTHMLGINPGGEIRTMEYPPELMDEFDERVPEGQRHRLLTREEIENQG